MANDAIIHLQKFGIDVIDYTPNVMT